MCVKTAKRLIASVVTRETAKDRKAEVFIWVIYPQTWTDTIRVDGWKRPVGFYPCAGCVCVHVWACVWLTLM